MNRVKYFWLPLVAAGHFFLLMWHYVPEIDACDGIVLPPNQVSTDMQTVRTRKERAESFDVVCVFEVAVMLLTLVTVYRTEKLTVVHRALPFFLLLSTFVVRLRHTGILGCAADDPECCSNLNCPSANFTTTLPGCASSYYHDDGNFGMIPIQWARKSFCPVPCWYSNSSLMNPTNVNCKDRSGVVQARCGGLAGTPDVASCYRYGCSREATPIPYYGVRLITANVVAFVCLVLVHHSRIDQSLQQLEDH